MATTLEKVKWLEQFTELKARLVRQLQAFEEQYFLKSKEFYARYEQGELGDDMDFMEWAATIEMVTNVESYKEEAIRSQILKEAVPL